MRTGRFSEVCERLGFDNNPDDPKLLQTRHMPIVIKLEIEMTFNKFAAVLLPPVGLHERPWRIMEIDEAKGLMVASCVQEC